MCFKFHFLFREKKSRGACTCSTSRDFINLNQIRGEQIKNQISVYLYVYIQLYRYGIMHGTLNIDCS